jgi:hypothetical protein
MMLEKFLEWCNRNSKSISLTIGGLNILSGISALVNGNYALAVVGFTIGGVLIFDAYREYK